jgi:hypothetical protein
MSNNTSYYYFFFFFLGGFLLSSAQTEIKGTVKDSSGNGISFLNIFIHPKNNNTVIAYSYTNNQGKYTITVKSSGDFILNVSGLAYKKKQVPFVIDSINPQKEIITDITLKEESFTLDDVVINVDNRPIVVKKDTISIRVSNFTNGTEDVVEDILKKLPGVEVSDDGTVKIQGKSIEKIMIEGDDLFDKGYKIITKNLNADIIEKVEILERFSDNPILKGIEDSDKVALNLTLKKDRKTSLFGNASIGYATNQFYESRLNLISFNKKTKYYFFGNLNNVGNDPIGDIYQLIYPDVFSGTTYVGDGIQAKNFISIGEDYINLNKNRTRFNNAELASLNGIYNPSKKLKLKGLTFFTSDETNFFRNNTQEYSIGDDSFINTEIYKLRKKNISGFGKLDAIYTFHKDARIEYSGKYSVINNENASNLLFNLEQLNEKLTSNSKFTDHRITYTKKLKDNKAVQFTGRYIYDEKPQQYAVDIFLFQELFPEQKNSDKIFQSIDNKTRFLGFESKYFTNTKNDNLDINIGLSQQKDDLKSTLFFREGDNVTVNTNESFNNTLLYDFTDIYVKGKYMYKFGSKIALRSRIELHKSFISIDMQNIKTKEQPFYVVPSLGITWKISKKNNLSTLYKYQTKNLSLANIYNGFIMTNYRNFKRGTGQFNQLTGNLLLTNYTYGNWASAFLFNASFLYQKDNNYTSTNAVITPNYNQSSIIILKNKEFYSLNASTDTFIEALSSNLKLKAGISKNEIQNIVNDSELRNVSSANYTFGAELRSAFGGQFNFHLGSKWIKSNVKTRLENTNTDNNSFLDLDFVFSKKLSLQIKNEHYYFGSLPQDRNYFFSDINAQYVIRKNALKVKLTFNNIWNTNNFASYYISDTSTSATNYRLLPMYILLKVDIRF